MDVVVDAAGFIEEADASVSERFSMSSRDGVP